MAILPKSKYSITSTATIARDILHSFLNIHFGLIVSISSGILSIKYNICLSDIINVINTNICSYVKAMLKQKPDFVDKKLSLSILEEIRNKIGDRADRMLGLT
ncbi:hypothetical protein H9L39_19390, partial [Fusarium oxysporum f. sp. albedinis]